MKTILRNLAFALWLIIALGLAVAAFFNPMHILTAAAAAYFATNLGKEILADKQN